MAAPRQQKLSLTQFGFSSVTGELVADPGVLRVAHNVICPAPGRVEKVRGFKPVTRTLLSTPNTATNSVISSKTFGQNVLLNTGITDGFKLTTSDLYYGDGFAHAWWSLLSPDSRSILNDSYTRMKSSVNQKTVYLTTQRTPLRMDGGIVDAPNQGVAQASLSYAGMPQAPATSYLQQTADELVDATTSNWLQPGFAVAYRVVYGVKDFDGNERLSPPSGRYIVSNVTQVAGYTGAPLCPTLTLVIPPQTETTSLQYGVFPTAGNRSVFVRVFRSQSFAVTAAGTPDDELQLCFEKYLSSTEVANGYFSFVDQCPTGGLTMALYTNAALGGDVSSGVLVAGSTGLGLASKNDRPPIALDTALFADCTFWANYKTPYRLQLSLLGVGAEEGDPLLSPGDTFDLYDPTAGSLQSFLAVSGVPGSSAEFKIESGYSSIAVNIRQTVMNLVSSINSWSVENGIGWVAVYNGSDSSIGTIGQFYLEFQQQEFNPNQITIGSPPFPVGASTSKPNTWNPLPAGDTGKGQGWQFTREEAQNGLAISKPFQGDAVPPVNYIRVGRSDTVIQRILPTTNALYIICDDGIYWLRGTAPTNFQVERLDPTCRIWFRESAVTLNDSVFFWAKEGLFQIQNGNTIRLDSPIRSTIESIRFNNSDPIVARSNFAWANPFDNTVTFCWANWDTANDGAGGSPYQALIWNANTNAWTSRQMNVNADAQFRTAKSCAVARWTDGAVFLGCPYDIGQPGLVFTDIATASGIGLPVYTDYSGNGATPTINYPITAVMEWVTSVPNPGGICHWSEFQAFSQNGSIVYSAGNSDLDLAYNINEDSHNPAFQLVDKFLVKISNEIQEYHTVATVLPTSTQGRVYLATGGGYSVRQVVRLEHQLNAANQAAGCSFTGFAIVYRTISGRTTR